MQPIDHEVLTGFQLGDEKALERVFRARFEPLAEQASAALGEDGGAAPKVVEGAFVRVWGERGKIDSPETLEAFLFDAVKTGAARERSRRAAAHRFAGGGHAATTHTAAATVTLDDAWQAVTTALHADSGVHSPKVQDQLHDQLRHDAAVHVASLAKRPAWQLPTLIAVVLAAVIFGAMRWMDRASADTAVTQALASPDGHTLGTLAAQSTKPTEIGDGSKVTLGADTKLRIPPNFGSTVRAVRLDGSASFDAAAATDARRPFIVRSGDADIKTAGAASFDVRGYPTDDAATVRVRSGSVTVKSLTTGASQVANAGQAVAVTKAGQVSTPSAADLAEAFGWADNKFVVNNKQLSLVLPLLVRWYGLELKVPDQSILTRPVTMTAPLASSREAISALEKAADVQFGYEGKTMTLTPKAAGAPAAPSAAKPAAKTK
jgi:ferric-dicitrate binding protein FerR (iron transport regulator)